MDSRFLSLLGLCKRAGKLAAGETLALEAIEAHKVRLVLVTEDCSPRSLRKLTNACGDRIPLMQVALSRAALGGALGWETCAAVAVEDGGFAARLAALVAQAQPEYAPLAEAAAARQEKLLRRKKEKPRKKR
ncbi:MAG: ribosomal L7Ae/L30e/S12e/Gadd45 family protein [Clostridiales bacterium]|nr:ribosomal L7Ae/L30e/S12e/Gadd45 family protein [Clostridiales bacterium]